jgi:hypothetical protein
MYCGQNVLWTKHPEGQNVLRDKTSSGLNILWTKRPVGQNLLWDKTSLGTKHPEKIYPDTEKCPMTMK